MHDVVVSVLGRDRFTEPVPDRAKFLPHVSIGYINRDESAQPIATALQALSTRPVVVTFTKADLLEYHLDHRMYEWTKATPVPIGQPTKSQPVSRRLMVDGSASGDV